MPAGTPFDPERHDGVRRHVGNNGSTPWRERYTMRAMPVSWNRLASAAARTSGFGIGAWLLFASGGALAHHGTSQYVMTEEIRLTGTVAEWTFESPHSWLRLQVTEPDGAVGEWSIESAPPGYMAAQGWSGASLERGERVTVLVSPLRDDAEPRRGILLEIDPADAEALVVRPRGRFGRPATLE